MAVLGGLVLWDRQSGDGPVVVRGAGRPSPRAQAATRADQSINPLANLGLDKLHDTTRRPLFETRARRSRRPLRTAAAASRARGAALRRLVDQNALSLLGIVASEGRTIALLKRNQTGQTFGWRWATRSTAGPSCASTSTSNDRWRPPLLGSARRKKRAPCGRGGASDAILPICTGRSEDRFGESRACAQRRGDARPSTTLRRPWRSRDQAATAFARAKRRPAKAATDMRFGISILQLDDQELIGVVEHAEAAVRNKAREESHNPWGT